MATAADHALHYKISNFTCTQDVLHYFRFVFLYLACCNFKFANTYIVRNDFSHDDIPLRERSYQLPSHCSVCLDSYENDVLVVHISSLIDSSSSFCKSFFTLSQLEVPKI